MVDLREVLKEKRPSLSDSSVTTYVSILKNLHKKVFPHEEINMKDYDDVDRILEFLHDVPPSRRKTILSALVVATQNPKYKESMLSDISEYQNMIATQEKSENQKEHWITYPQVLARLKELEQDAKLLYKKKNQTMTDLQHIQNYIILALLSGKYVAPRRSMDYCCMRIRNCKKEDNYIDGNKFIFNKYKTAKYSGTQEILISSQLRKILDKWISKNNHTDWLLYDNNSQPLTSIKLNQRLNKIFQDKLSTNSLRHAYLTHMYGNTIKLNEQISNTMKSMGSSAAMALNYIKKDSSDSD